MPRIIVNALQKRNETGLVPLSASGAGENVTCLQSLLPIDMYKSTQPERLNLYRCALTSGKWFTRTSDDATTASREKTVTAQHPSASQLRQRDPARSSHGAAFRNILAQKVQMALQFS